MIFKFKSNIWLILVIECRLLNTFKIWLMDDEMKVINRTKAVTQHFLKISFKKLSIKKKGKKKKHFKNTKIVFYFLIVCCAMVFYVFLCRSVCWFCTGHFVMVPLNLTYLHCLQHSFFEHLFNLYYVLCLISQRHHVYLM